MKPTRTSTRLGALLCVLTATLGLAVWTWHVQPALTTRATAAAESPAAPAANTGTPAISVAPTAAAATPFETALDRLRAKVRDGASPDAVMRELAGIAQSDPGLAIDLAQALGSTDEEKSAWVTDLAKAWVASDPQQAWNWLTQLEPSRLRELANGTIPEVIIGSLAHGAPDQLLRNLDLLVHRGETALGVPPVVAVHLAIDALADTQLPAARAAVEAWAGDPRRPLIGAAAFVGVASAMAKTAPNEAGAWLLSLPASEQRDTAITEFPGHWAQTQPQAALDWVEHNVPRYLQPAAVQRAFSDWVESDAGAASEWLQGYLARSPSGVGTDRLIGDVVNLSRTLQTNPALALAWTNLMTDPANRVATEERVALRWGQLDRNAALDYIARSSTLPPARKQALLAKLTNL